MVTTPKLDLDSLAPEGKVDSRVYTDPAILELEFEKIFHKTWVYVAHESELPDGGDYKLTHIGKHPVIVARSSDDGQVRVFFNRCRHRGATVCQLEYGNSNYFRCAYHGWVYNNGGGLVGVPFEEGYGEGFDKQKLGLVQVPRVDSYRGLIFASLSADGQTLEEHLGNAKLGLDFILADSDLVVSKGFNKFTYGGNWKLQLENTVDGYHVGVLHKGFFEIVERRTGFNRAPTGDLGRHRDLGGGHSTHSDDPYDPDFKKPESGLFFNIGVFPNLDILALERDFPTQLRIVRPLAPDRTEVFLFPLLKKGAAREVNFDRLRRFEEFYGPAGFASPDDWEIFGRVQRGVQANGIEGSQWSLHLRGLHTEQLDERGIRTNRNDFGEASQRAFFRHWKKLLSE
ncbi:MAG TPA: Rieske 2Fe-2S domain-containing protein [Dehalococcoidia bacterium]|nr:Rieske 2Fe-2S domain-containing protein [Dehalococcoidia bacterium]